MALKPEQIEQLLSMIKKTREVEMTCTECLDQLDWYVQSSANSVPVEGMLELVRQHLEACPFCMTELKLVLETLEAMED